MADSNGLPGAYPVAWRAADWLALIRPPTWVVCQLSLVAMIAPELLCRSSCGSARALGTPYWASEGPIARITTLLGWVRAIKPRIMTLLPTPTNPRVLMLISVELELPSRS